MSPLKVEILWSPISPEKFITFGTDLRLYHVEESDGKEGNPKISISENTCAALQSINTDHQYMKCVAWYPKPDYPDLLAIGHANGKVVLTCFDHSSTTQDLAGREFVPKHARQCNCVAWNPVDHNLLASGFDRNRSDCGLLIWDTTRLPINPYANESTPTHERRQSAMGYLQSDTSASSGTTCIYKPYSELGLSETANSLFWFFHQPKTFVCGMNNKHLKIYDLRDNSKHQNSTSTKSVFGVCVDPYYENRLASFVENQVMIWDVRNFEKPVVTLNESRPIVKLSWSPKRGNLLASLTKESNFLKLYDVQQAPLHSDDIEPTIVERNVQPHGQQELLSFSWHPMQENRLLTICVNSTIRDYTVFDRITLNWAPTSELIWTHGKKLLQCIDNRNQLFESLEDISIKMKIRAQLGYGLKTQQLSLNGDVVSDDPNLQRLWNWLDNVKSLHEEGLLKAYASRKSEDMKYEGVRSIINHENNGTVGTKSEPFDTPWQGLERMSVRNVTTYKSDNRDHALLLCGWGSDADGKSLNLLLEKLESEKEFERSAAIAVFNLKLRRAINILSKGAQVRGSTKAGDTSLNVVAMALSGYTEERQALWREMCQSLRPQLENAYLRAMFAFLTSDHTGNYEDVLNEKGIEVQDKVAFACMFLPDGKLANFLDQLSSRMIEIGDLDGIILTGLTHEGLSLLQSYVDQTGDVQTVSLIISHSQSPTLCRNPRSMLWVDSYKHLLNSWRLWQERCLFDLQWYKANPSTWPRQQVFVSCNYCAKSISIYLMQIGQAHGPRNFARYSMVGANKGKVTSCPGCRKPLPRCALDLTNLGTAAGSFWKPRSFGNQEQADLQQQKLSKFSSWFSWCQSCRHGGHAGHTVEWFKEHTECPFSGCTCKCQMLDPVAAASNGS